MIRLLLMLLAAAIFQAAGEPAWAVDPAPRVGRFELHEVALAATGQYANPYADVVAQAAIVPPVGRPTRVIPLFWDGGATWRFRFSPAELGTWTWTVKSADAGLNGKAGSFEVVAAQRRGSIRPMAGFPQHLERQDGSPFWFLGDTAWALYYDREEEQYDRRAALAYLDARAAQGFNVVHSALLSELGWGNRGGMPFDDIAAEKLNAAYWQEVDLRLAHANHRGLVCGLAPAWGDKRGVEPFAWRRFPSLAARLRYARYIAARYSAFDTYFLVAGEWHAEIRARQSTEAAIKQEFGEIAQALAAADPHGRMIGIHPMTSHGSVREFAAEPWMTFGDYQQNYRDLHGRILESRATHKPIVNSEYGYLLRDSSGDGIPDKDNSTSLAAMRSASWDIALAGGYLVTGFGTTYLGGGRDPGPFDLTAAKNKPWEEQIGHLRSIFARTEWWKLAPHDELLTCETRRGRDSQELGYIAPPQTTYWCLAEPGRQYLVYYRGLRSPLGLALETKTAAWTAVRINPRTNEQVALAAPAGDRLDIRPPDDQDWVVLVTAQRP